MKESSPQRGGGVAAPTPADAYLAAYPVAKSFMGSQQPPPVSYATLSYFGINSFKFTNAQGQVSFGRYRIEPCKLKPPQS